VAPGSELYCSSSFTSRTTGPSSLDRYVLPKLAPDYLKVDFNQTTPTLPGQGAPLQEAEHLCAR